MTDLNVKCIDCGSDFTITDGDQEFFKSKDLHLPKRCVPCRRKRKESRENDIVSQGRDQR